MCQISICLLGSSHKASLSVGQANCWQFCVKKLKIHFGNVTNYIFCWSLNKQLKTHEKGLTSRQWSKIVLLEQIFWKSVSTPFANAFADLRLSTTARSKRLRDWETNGEGFLLLDKHMVALKCFFATLLLKDNLILWIQINVQFFGSLVGTWHWQKCVSFISMVVEMPIWKSVSFVTMTTNP